MLKTTLPIGISFYTFQIMSYTIDVYRGHANDIEDGYSAKLEYPLKENAIINASEKFRYLYEKYMKDKDVNICLSIIPDKGYFLAGKNGYPSLDYDKLFDLMKHNMEFAEYILELNDYYKTDIHWRQEKIFKVTEKIGAAMVISEELSGSYTMIKTDVPFYGVYYGQSALPIGHDKIYYLTNETIDNCSVYNIETKNTTSIYDIEKLNSYDPYGVFLSGATPLLIIENPNIKTDKELIVLRNSFGSSYTMIEVKSKRSGSDRISKPELKH